MLRLTAFRQPSDCRFRSISRPGAFGKARAQCCMQTQGDHHGEAGFHFDGHTKRDFGGLSTPLEAA